MTIFQRKLCTKKYQKIALFFGVCFKKAIEAELQKIPLGKPCDRTYSIKAVRHHNRQLHKATILKGGVRKNNQAERYVKGFRLFDKVLFDSKECFIWGRRKAVSLPLRLSTTK